MLQNLIFKQKAVDLGLGERSHSNGRLTTEGEAQHKKGKKCLLCPMMSNKSLGGF